MKLNRRSNRPLTVLGMAVLTVAVGASAPAAASGATPATAFVRVNQVGYPANASKRACHT
jgi:hypothetical protein